jgi:hypothetical protein
MTLPPEPQDRITIIQAATEALGTVSEKLDAVTARLDEVRSDSEARDAVLEHRGIVNRRLIVVTIASLLLDVILTAVIALVALQAHHADQRASSAAASQMALCESGNVARKQQIDLWNFVIDLSSKSRPQTPQQRENAVKFEKYLHRVFASRDCAHLVKQK